MAKTSLPVRHCKHTSAGTEMYVIERFRDCYVQGKEGVKGPEGTMKNESGEHTTATSFNDLEGS